MALDFAILDDGGAPREQVSIRMNAHHRLMQLVKQESESLLVRAVDFYEDTEFFPVEIPALVREVESLLARCVDDEELAVFLEALKNLAAQACAANARIAVIAD